MMVIFSAVFGHAGVTLDLRFREENDSRVFKDGYWLIFLDGRHLYETVDMLRKTGQQPWTAEQQEIHLTLLQDKFIIKQAEETK